MGKKHHTMDEGGGNLHTTPSVRRSYNSSSSPHGQVVTTMDHITGVEGSHHKYVKPRVGFQFQARLASSSVASKHSNSISNGTSPPSQRPGRGRGRGRGRPPGRPPKKPSLSTSTSSSSLARSTSNISLPVGSDETDSVPVVGFPTVPVVTSSGAIIPRDSVSLQILVPPRGGICVHRPATGVASLEQQNHFLTFARNLILETPRTTTHSNEQVTEESISASHDQWKHNMMEKYSTSKSAKLSLWDSSDSSKKQTKKRKRQKKTDKDMGADKRESVDSTNKEEPPVHVDNDNINNDQESSHSSLTSQLQPQQTITEPNMNDRPLDGMEADEAMLYYLQTNHGGNCESAKFMLMAELCRGTATNAYRTIRKRIRAEEGLPKEDLVPLSESWRKRCDHYFPIMLGDLRSEPGASQYSLYESIHVQTNCEHVQKEPMSSNNPNKRSISDAHGDDTHADDISSNGSGTEDSKSIASSGSFISVQNDLSKAVWKSLLKSGEALLKMIQDNHMEGSTTTDSKNTSDKPLLEEVMTVVDHAYALSVPEDVFVHRRTTVERISTCMNGLLDGIFQARNARARIFDLIHDETGQGIDIDLLRKAMDEAETKSSILLQFEPIREMISKAYAWEEQRDKAIGSVGDASISDGPKMGSLARAEQLALEARSIGFRPRSVVSMENRIARAHVLREKIREWDQARAQEKSENIKFISSMVREADRIDLLFPEVSMVSTFHRSADEWIDRATIAVRSKISLSELESLVESGEQMPVNVSDLLEKLKPRLEQARDWIDRFQSMVPCPFIEKSDEDTDADTDGPVVDNLTWMSRMRIALRNSHENTLLVNIATEASGIPVEIDCLKLFQIELDAKNWSLRTAKWLPVDGEGDDSSAPDASGKKGKIDMLREHLEKAEAIREKLPMTPDEQVSWSLEYETELTAIVESADEWFEKNQEYLDGDNRRQQARPCVSITELRKIVEEANAIHANLGNAGIKMSRILGQAESWLDKHRTILCRCGVNATYLDDSPPEVSGTVLAPMAFSVLNAALSSASSDISLDLKEAVELAKVGARIQDWFDRCVDLAPKRTKRVNRKKSPKKKRSVEDLISLIEEAETLPVDTSEALERLRMQLSVVQSWRLHAQTNLRNIVDIFRELRMERVSSNESLEKLLPGANQCSKEEPVKASAVQHHYDTKTAAAESDKKPFILPSSDIALEETRHAPRASPTGSGESISSKGKNIHEVVMDLLKSSDAIAIHTVEQEIAEKLESVADWCTKAAQRISSPEDIFEKQGISDFDSFVKEGNELLRMSQDPNFDPIDQLYDKELVSDLASSSGGLISDELQRLEMLRCHRDNFLAWCEKVEAFFAVDDKKMSLRSLVEISEESAKFPSRAEIVTRVRSKAKVAAEWADSANKVIESTTKLSVQEAKDMIAEGDRLNIACSELKALRSALRTTRSWAARVKKSDIDSGDTHISEVKELIAEHASFIVTMPEEINQLKQALCGYCLCRRPYDGFMIVCDGCEEWYHCPCIGLTKAQADRYDKYTCVRCCVHRVYTHSTDTLSLTIRKWTNAKVLSKARQIDSQKHQRKVREKDREIIKLTPEIEALEKELEKVQEANKVETTIVVPQNDDFKKTSTQNSSIENGHGTNTHQDGVTMEEITDSAVMDTSKEVGSDKIKEIVEKLQKNKEMIAACKTRLEELKEISNNRKSTHTMEDLFSSSLRRWCILLRSIVVAPITEAEAAFSRPLTNGTISEPMMTAINVAKLLGISDLPDVSSTISAFHCISWCIRAIVILSRKPSMEELKSLIAQSSSITLPEEKSLRMLSAMVSRANVWQAKVLKALAPHPGSTVPYDIRVLTALGNSARDIPIIMSEEARLWNTIEDGGTRHCICGGPSDGSFMLGCDKCDRWFHGSCVQTEKQNIDSISNCWVCPPCSSITPSTIQNEEKRDEQDHVSSIDDLHDVESTDTTESENVSSHAPKPEELWPPFGLANSTKAVGAVGESHDSDKNEVDALMKLRQISNEVSEVLPKSMKNEEVVVISNNGINHNDLVTKKIDHLQNGDGGVVTMIDKTNPDL